MNGKTPWIITAALAIVGWIVTWGAWSTSTLFKDQARIDVIESQMKTLDSKLDRIIERLK